ncbi:MAG: hypothetical protein Q8M94_00925 [Ignavibacteria bacterium]|nr:hypothetical protein [Ignavibacteria bacterium]
MKTLLIPILICLMFISSCNTSENTSSIIEPFNDNSVENTNLKIIGNVVYYTIEGGFYAINEESNRVYEPINLPERFQIDGLKVYVEAKRRTDLGTRRQVGEAIQIRTIKQR